MKSQIVRISTTVGRYNDAKANIECQDTPHPILERPRLRWMDQVLDDLKVMGVTVWRAAVK